MLQTLAVPFGQVHPLGPFAAWSSLGLEVAALALCVVAIVALGARRREALAAALEALARPGHERAFVAVTASAAFLVTACCAVFVLERFPNSADEYGYLFLRDTLLAGRWWNPTHPLQEFFSFVHVAEKDGRWVSRFLPGWSLVLAGARVVHFPAWLVTPLIGAVTLVLVHRFARRLSLRAAPVATLLVAISGFFVFNSASYRSHALTALLVLLFAERIAALVDHGRPRDAWIAGAALGFALLTRPYTALLCTLPFACWWLASRRASAALLVQAGAAVLPFAGFLLYYNQKTTGDALQLVTSWMDADEGFGFVKGHTLGQGFEHLFRRLGSFVEWTVPPLLFLQSWLACRVGRARPGRRGLLVSLAAVLPALALGHLMYYAFGGTQYGPRFYYEALPFGAIFVAEALFGDEPLVGLPARRRAFAALLAGTLFAAVSLPFMMARQHRIVNERLDLYRLVEEQRLSHAVVLVGSPTGKIWPMGVGDLLRNGIAIDEASVIYARDRGLENARLLAAFPDRHVYRYDRDPDQRGGTLTLVR